AASSPRVPDPLSFALGFVPHSSEAALALAALSDRFDRLRGFALQLSIVRQPARIERSFAHGAHHRTTMLILMIAVAELAPGGEVCDVLEGLLDPSCRRAEL